MLEATAPGTAREPDLSSLDGTTAVGPSAAVPPAAPGAAGTAQPRTEPTQPVPARRPVLSARAARLAGLLMFAGFVAAVLIEPAPDGPQPVLPVWVDLIATATLVALLGCWAALAAGRRSGLRLGAVAGVGLVGQVALCPALDHHVLAGWWWVQLAVGVGIAALSIGLLARTRA